MTRCRGLWIKVFIVLSGTVFACQMVEASGMINVNIPEKASRLSLYDDAFQYSGEYTDKESRLQYLSARYYNPQIPRFISRDDYDLVNRYGYVDGNPIGNVDPSGHMAMSWDNAATLGVGLGTGILGALGGAGYMPETYAAGIGFLGNLGVSAGLAGTHQYGSALVNGIGALASYVGLPSTNPEAFPLTSHWATEEAYKTAGYQLLEGEGSSFLAMRKAAMAKWGVLATALSGIQLGLNTSMNSSGNIDWSYTTLAYAGSGLVGGVAAGYAYGWVGASMSDDLRQSLKDGKTGGGMFLLKSSMLGAVRSGVKEFVRSTITNTLVGAYFAETGQSYHMLNTILADTISGAIFGTLSGLTSEPNRVAAYKGAFTYGMLMTYRGLRDVELARVQNMFHNDLNFTSY